MNKIFSFIIVLAVIGGGVFLYITRPVAVPTENIQDQVEPVTTDDTSSASGTQLAGTTDEGTTYRIGSSSKATFSINEVLNDKPFNAVGTTSQIAGEINVTDNDVENMYFMTLGTVKIDARTFKTDSEKRDGAIVRMILKSENEGNEYISFTPKEKTISFTDGQSFDVAGNLTISGVTKPVTFKVTATKTADKVTGKATANVKRSDFNLTIPNVPFVASVEDTFVISADIVASKK